VSFGGLVDGLPQQSLKALIDELCLKVGDGMKGCGGVSWGRCSRPPLSIEGRYATTDTNVLQFSQPGTFSDPLTEVLRNGARTLLAQAVEAEVATLRERRADEVTDDGRRRLVRHGRLPEREIMTGIGPIAVRCPRVRDRVGQGPERIHFSSAILPPYARRSKSLEPSPPRHQLVRHWAMRAGVNAAIPHADHCAKPSGRIGVSSDM